MKTVKTSRQCGPDGKRITYSKEGTPVVATLGPDMAAETQQLKALYNYLIGAVHFLSQAVNNCVHVGLQHRSVEAIHRKVPGSAGNSFRAGDFFNRRVFSL